MLDDDLEPRESVDLPIPEPPSEDYPGGGHWRWVGRLPRTRVDVSDDYCLAVYVVRRDSTHARTLERDGATAVQRRGVNRVPKRPETDGDGKHVCAVCGRGFETGSALGGHRRSHSGAQEEAPTPTDSPPRRISRSADGATPKGDTKTGLTAAMISRCVLAVLEGRQIGEFIEEERFRGNRTALAAWTNAVVHSVDPPSYRRLSPEERERVASEVLRVKGGPTMGGMT